MAQAVTACITQPGCGYRPQDQTASACRIGTYSSGSNQQPCTPCPAGLTTVAARAETVAACMAPPGYFFQASPLSSLTGTVDALLICRKLACCAQHIMHGNHVPCASKLCMQIHNCCTSRQQLQGVWQEAYCLGCLLEGLNVCFQHLATAAGVAVVAAHPHLVLGSVLSCTVLRRTCKPCHAPRAPSSTFLYF